MRNKERILDYIGKNEFLKLVGFEIETIEEGIVEGTMVLENKHKQQKGLLHGGVTATLADVVSGFAAYTMVGEDEQVVTAELKVSYLNPGTGDQLKAKGWVLKSGRRMNFCEAEIYSIENGKSILIAKASSTMATILSSDLKR